LTQQGGVISPGVELGIGAPAGTFYSTLDGSYPRLPGGAISSSALALPSTNGSIRLEGASQVFARVYTARPKNPWSAPARGIFSLERIPSVVISEIMYHPPAPPAGSPFQDDNDFEFVELVNLEPAAVNLAGYRFVEGIQFVFSDTSLAPGQSVVLVRNRGAFVSRYPSPSSSSLIAGEYGGSLSNGGETLTLQDAAGRTVCRVTYRDDQSWPRLADGWGNSLELIDPFGNFDLFSNWLESATVGGSPGIIPWQRLEIGVEPAQGQPRGHRVRIRFRASSGEEYAILFRDDLSGGEWRPLQPGNLHRDGDWIEVTDVPEGLTRFYRVLSRF
jgi:hypothetical protein